MSPAIIGLLQKASRHHRPKQIAWAIVWGCACGLIPKSSLLFFVGLAVALAMPIHLIAALVTMCAVSLVCIPLNTILGNIGHWILSATGAGQWIQFLDRFPLVPWLKLHNTVTTGALASSLTLCLPGYWIISGLLQKWHAEWERMQLTLIGDESTLTAEPAAEVSVSRVATQPIATQPIATQPIATQPIAAQLPSTKARPAVVAPQVEPQPLAAALDKFDQSMSTFTATQRRGSTEQVATSLSGVIDSIHALEDLLDSANSDYPVDATAVLARANQASELVDDILQSLDTVCLADLPTDQPGTAAPSAPHSSQHKQLRIDAPQVFNSHDTKISIYRRARTGETTVASSDNNAPSEKDSMPTATDVEVPQSNLGANNAITGQTASTNIATSQSTESGLIHKHDSAPHEEALRHLLNHLRALKEKV